MDLNEAKKKLEKAEALLSDALIATFATFDTPHGSLHVSVTQRLRRKCRRGKIWKSSAMLSALKNAVYGLNPGSLRSRGGSDGIFCIDRSFRPINSMMKKLYDQFLDKPDPLVATLSTTLGSASSEWIPVRLVSHHLRLLGIFSRFGDSAKLVLIDFDNEKKT